MTLLSYYRVTGIWLILILATFLSVTLGHGVIADDRVATSLLLAIALLKVRFVGLEFMELRTAPLPLRLSFEVWAFGVWAVLVGLMLFAA